MDKPFRRDLLSWPGTGDRVAKSRARGCEAGRTAFTVVPRWRHPCAAFRDRGVASARQTARRHARPGGRPPSPGPVRMRWTSLSGAICYPGLARVTAWQRAGPEDVRPAAQPSPSFLVSGTRAPVSGAAGVPVPDKLLLGMLGLAGAPRPPVPYG